MTNTLHLEARILIVGAGHAGGRTAVALRDAGHRGPITLIGTEVYPPYERPPLSKELLSGGLPLEKTFVRPLAWYDTAQIALHTCCTAVGIDRQARQVVLADSTAVPYDRLVLATGARARRLPVPGADGPNVFYLRDMADAIAVGKRLGAGTRLAIIGAGFIGLEVAATARRLGAQVYVLEAAAQPLARIVSSELGFFFADMHRKEGVEIRTGVTVTAIDSQAHGVKLYTRDGETLSADLAVIGIGAVPNTEIASAAGLAVDDGIVVDQWGVTSDPAISAVGDACRHFNPLLGRHIRLESWQNAQNQPLVAARRLLGAQEPYAEVPWFWTDQYDVNFQLAGAPVKWDQAITRGIPYTAGFIQVLVDEDVPVGALAINNGREMRWVRELIARGLPVERAALSDPGTRLQDLVPGVRM